MSEHEHKILQTMSGGFYCAYVDCDLELKTPEDFMALLDRTKALEGVLELFEWQTNLLSGVSKSGGEPTSAEWLDCVEQSKEALAKLEEV